MWQALHELETILRRNNRRAGYGIGHGRGPDMGLATVAFWRELTPKQQVRRNKMKKLISQMVGAICVLALLLCVSVASAQTVITTKQPQMTDLSGKTAATTAVAYTVKVSTNQSASVARSIYGTTTNELINSSGKTAVSGLSKKFLAGSTNVDATTITVAFSPVFTTAPKVVITGTNTLSPTNVVYVGTVTVSNAVIGSDCTNLLNWIAVE